MCLKVELQSASRFYKAQGNTTFSMVMEIHQEWCAEANTQTPISQITYVEILAVVASSTSAVDEVVLLEENITS